MSFLKLISWGGDLKKKKSNPGVGTSFWPWNELNMMIRVMVSEESTLASQDG